MAVQLAVADDFDSSETRAPARSGAATRPRRIPRHTGVVLASSVAEVVDCLGGWIFDRTLAGCETIVFTPTPGDTRALAILGAKTADYGDIPVVPGWCDSFGVLAVSAAMYEADQLAGEAVDARRSDGTNRTYLWGERPGAGSGREFAVITPHQVSLAGQAFKRQALAAAGLPVDRQSAAELLWSEPGSR
ncbi:hypothetical protein ACFWPH_28830 [Nocardia sp. NPDC058499]|uniref:hypothetical protein n=1 Tax=Nocardia sp. NPDC058499 TaxID=3346530 RepID=UPI0036480498